MIRFAICAAIVSAGGPEPFLQTSRRVLALGEEAEVGASGVLAALGPCGVPVADDDQPTGTHGDGGYQPPGTRRSVRFATITVMIQIAGRATHAACAALSRRRSVGVRWMTIATGSWTARTPTAWVILRVAP